MNGRICVKRIDSFATISCTQFYLTKYTAHEEASVSQSHNKMQTAAQVPIPMLCNRGIKMLL
jgi:hypothetical protein